MLGLDLGARFLRSAVCDLEGDVRARAGRRARRRRRRRGARRARRCAARWSTRPGCRRSGSTASSSGCPGWSTPSSGVVQLAENVSGPRGPARSRTSSRRGSACPSRSRTTSTSRPSASSGAASREGSRTSRSSRSARASAAGSSSAASSTAATTARPGEIDFALIGLGEDVDPCARARVGPRRALRRGAATACRRRTRCARSSPPRARGERSRTRGRRRGGAPDRAAHRARSRPSRMSSSSSSAAASARTATCCSRRARQLLAEWLPYPPRVEVSSLGEAAVLTGALAVGLRAALDNVFANRAAAK